MDRAFVLDYAVIEALTGNSKGANIEFIGFYHYGGLPDYTRYDPALVILEASGELMRLRRIDAVEKKDGKWWVCEERSDDDNAECTGGRYVEEILADVSRGA